MSDELKQPAKKEDSIRVPKSAVFLVGGIILGLVLGFLVGRLNGANNLPTGAAVAQQGGGTGGVLAKVSADDDPFLGEKNAPVTIIEFSDFQCPFCRRHYSQTYSQLKSEYIATGKVKYVYRDFPLSFHEGAQPYAEAAECAAEQNKYWELHDKIYDEQNKQGQGTVPYPGQETVLQWAGEIGLDTGKLKLCIESGKYTKEVQKDFTEGASYGVTGTPSFFIGNDKKGYVQVEGAQPFSAFQSAIDAALG